MHSYIERTLEPAIVQAASRYPIVVISGPRQSGKTTTLRRLFERTHRYVALDQAESREWASSDPKAFLAAHRPPLLLDEVLSAPAVIHCLCRELDGADQAPGRYLLASSQDVQVVPELAAALAEHASFLHLYPLARCEVDHNPNAPLPWETESVPNTVEAIPRAQLWSSLLTGGYPELALNPGTDQARWQAEYVRSVFERDVRALRQIGGSSQFHGFLRGLAMSSTQLLNISDLARELGITVNTVKAWMSVLEATYQITVLRPYVAEVGKRLVKTPKVYFTDVGTLCYLNGFSSPEQAAAGPMGSAIFETAVVSEILKALIHRGREPAVFFWRTSAGSEVDVIVEAEDRIIPFEVTLSASPKPAMLSGIRALRRDLADRTGPGYIVHPGKVDSELSADGAALPFCRF